MIDQDLINQINKLAKIEKDEGLTQEQKLKQKQLRKEYLEQFRKQFRTQVETITVVDEEGNDVTPEKLKQIKNKNDPSVM